MAGKELPSFHLGEGRYVQQQGLNLGHHWKKLMKKNLLEESSYFAPKMLEVELPATNRKLTCRSLPRKANVIRRLKYDVEALLEQEATEIQETNNTDVTPTDEIPTDVTPTYDTHETPANETHETPANET